MRPWIVGSALFLLFAAGGILWAENGSGSFPENFLAEFEEAGIRERRAVFAKYLEDRGAAEILGALESRVPICHSEAHELGRALLAKTGDLYGSIQACGSQCSSGCFHGIFVEAFENIGRPSAGHVSGEELAARINEICDHPLVGAIHNKGSCVHGVGHAFVQLEEYDLARSLELCGLFADKRLRFYCSNGAFMEFVHEGKAASNNLHAPCDEFLEFPAACYRYAVPRMMERLGLEGTVRECMGLAGFRRLGCFHGLGLSGLGEDPAGLSEVCGRGGTEDDRKACVEGGIELFADQEKEKALRSCEYFEPELKAVCLAGANRKMFSLDRDFSLYFSGD